MCQAPTKRSSGDASVTVSRPGGCHVESRWPPPMCRPSQLGGQRSHSFFQSLLPTCGCAHTGCGGGKSAPYTHPATGSLRQVAGPWPLAIRARARSGRGSAQALQRVSCALPRSVQEGTREALRCQAARTGSALYDRHAPVSRHRMAVSATTRRAVAAAAATLATAAALVSSATAHGAMKTPAQRGVLNPTFSEWPVIDGRAERDNWCVALTLFAHGYWLLFPRPDLQIPVLVAAWHSWGSLGGGCGIVMRTHMES